MALRAGGILRDMRQGCEAKRRSAELFRVRREVPGPQPGERPGMGMVVRVLDAMARRSCRGNRAGLSSMFFGGRNSWDRAHRGKSVQAHGDGSGRAATMEGEE